VLYADDRQEGLNDVAVGATGVSLSQARLDRHHPGFCRSKGMFITHPRSAGWAGGRHLAEPSHLKPPPFGRRLRRSGRTRLDADNCLSPGAGGATPTGWC
jgi:hypothetical protein